MSSLIRNNLKEDLKHSYMWAVVIGFCVVLVSAQPLFYAGEKNLLQELMHLSAAVDMTEYPDGMWDYNICTVIDHMMHWSFFYMTLPLAGLPVIIRFCEENSSGFSHMLVIRSGTKKYLISNVISGGIVAFISVVISVLILFWGIGSILPKMGADAVEQMVMENALYGWISAYQGGVWYVFIRACSAGVMAVFAVQLALLTAVFTENKFLSVAVPMTVLETWQQYSMGKTGFTPTNLLAPWSGNFSTYDNLTLSCVNHFIPLALACITSICFCFSYYERKVKRGE